MLEICNLYECYTEQQIDSWIDVQKTTPVQYTCKIDKVVEDDPRWGTFYLASGSRYIWYFGPRNPRGVAGPESYAWFCFRTRDGKFHKFNVCDIPHSREAMNKILDWIARGSATDGPVLNLTQDEVEFMDI